jgi:thiol-disulfide isomerase/thioredoxin
MKVKNVGCAIFMLLFLQTAFAQSKFDSLFTLKAKLNFVHKDSVYLYYENMKGQSIFQLLPIFNDSFMITDSICKPVKALILFKNIGEVIADKDIEGRGKEIYLEHGLLTLTGDPSKLDELKLTGSDTQDQLDTLNTDVAPIKALMKPLVDVANKEPDLEKAARMRTKFEPYEDRIKKIDYRFFLQHPNSYLTADLMEYYVTQVSLDSATHIYKNFNAQLKQSSEAITIAAEIKKMESALPGNMAADFTATDLNGNTVSLADYKGKYVLLDFWASWCDACRRTNPHLIDLYNRYNSKGLNIIGIADNDATPEAWKNAIAKDCLDMWPNLLLGAETPNDIGDKYAIHFVPTKILIDPDGKIIGRFGDNNNRDYELDRMLANIFKELIAKK